MLWSTVGGLCGVSGVLQQENTGEADMSEKTLGLALNAVKVIRNRPHSFDSLAQMIRLTIGSDWMELLVHVRSVGSLLL